MLYIKVTGDLKKLPSEYKSWYFTVACGHGPTISSSSSSSPVKSCSVVTPYSSPDVASGELKLHFYALPDPDKEKEKEEEKDKENVEAEEEKVVEVAVLVGTRIITVQKNESKEQYVSDFKLKTSAGDLIETVIIKSFTILT